MGRPFRFLHAADLHLDTPFKGVDQAPDALRDYLRVSGFRALDALADEAVARGADFVLLAGDTFDLADRSLRARLKFQEAMQRLAREGIGVYMVYGNHDPADGLRADWELPHGVQVYPAGGMRSLTACNRAGAPVAVISGYSYPAAAVKENVSALFRTGAASGLYRIGLLHANLDGDPEHDNYAPCSLADLLDCPVDYWALGHIHHRAVRHERPYVVYPGNLQGRHIREDGAKGAYWVEVDGDGETSLTFLELDVCRWTSLEVDIRGLSSEQDLASAMDQALLEALEPAGGRSVLARIRLTGRGILHKLAVSPGWLEEWIAEARERARLQLEQGGPFVWPESAAADTAPEIDLSRYDEEDGFLGELRRMSAALAADRNRAASYVMEALQPLLEHARLGRLLAPEAERQAARWLERAAERVLERLAEGDEP